MPDIEEIRAYAREPRLLRGLSLTPGTPVAVEPLGNGEYNCNYLLTVQGRTEKMVLRVNLASQMHLADQIGYEYRALEALVPSGRTPHPLYLDGSRDLVPYGVLVMEWLPGRALDYRTDMAEAAAILADIHSTPVPERCPLLRPEEPLRAMYDECRAMSQVYLRWENAAPSTAARIERMLERASRLPLASRPDGPPCIINTELNSGNFLIHPGRSSLVDWEKPLLGEAAQDLGHVLAPTTTFWKTDVLLTPEEMRSFFRRYCSCAAGVDAADVGRRLPLYLWLTCLRGITWCSMAMVEYSTPGREVRNEDTYRKLFAYLEDGFLDFVEKDFMCEDNVEFVG